MAKTKSEGQIPDFLEGVNERTTKAVLLDKLREAARWRAGAEDDRVKRLQEIEERVRAQFGPSDVELRSVTLKSTPEEFEEMIDFLDNFQDIMPIAMKRLLAGALSVVGRDEV